MTDNPMQNIFLDKVVLNIGIGDNEDNYEGAKLLLGKLTGHTIVSTRARQRVPELKLRKGQIIGAVVTLRRKEAAEMLRRALVANDNAIKPSSIAGNSLSFGVKEYIYFSGVKYDPKIGMLGLNVNASFARKGNRVKQRRRKTSVIGKKHSGINRDIIREYMEKNFNVKIQ